MRKIKSMMMGIALLAVTLTACGGKEQASAPSQNPETSAAVESQSQAVAASEETENTAAAQSESGPVPDKEEPKMAGNPEAYAGKVLVVYYSASGHTGDVAEVIAEYTGGDLFELVPVEEYTSEDLNWRQEDSRVNREHEDESLQDIQLVSATVENFDSYDTVFIGYPIWWQNASWVVNSFVKENDFTGKTVIPFCTSTSSGFGDSGKNLEKMAGTGEWKDGERFGERPEKSEVTEWLDSLGL